MVERIKLRQEDAEKESFRQIVQSESYLSLATNQAEKDRELFGEEAFVIIPPRRGVGRPMRLEHQTVRRHGSAGRTTCYVCSNSFEKRLPDAMSVRECDTGMKL